MATPDAALGLAFAAGAMLYVISHEIIPESRRMGHEANATGTMGGFVLAARHRLELIAHHRPYPPSAALISFDFAQDRLHPSLRWRGHALSSTRRLPLNPMTNAIEVESLRKTYPSNVSAPVHALNGVSFRVREGGVSGLLGPNGAGKTTLVKIVSTITTPTSGRAAIFGLDVTQQPLAARRKMAVVLQQTAAETLLNIRDNLLIYAYLHGLEPGEANKRMHTVAEEFDLADRLRDTVQDLSIGTKRRIQVAKIFMLDSPLIILDEATTGMDPLMKRRVIERIRAEARKGRTVLLTTHVLSEAEELCDEIMIIDRGRMLASGTLAELRKLSQQTFRVTLTFAESDGVDRLRVLDPLELKVDGRQVEMLFRGDEAGLLAGLAEISRATPIQQFEVRGPNLEEIFVTLVKDNE